MQTHLRACGGSELPPRLGGAKPTGGNPIAIAGQGMAWHRIA